MSPRQAAPSLLLLFAAGAAAGQGGPARFAHAHPAPSNAAPDMPMSVASPVISGFPCYRTVEETHSSAAALASAYPALATWTDIGDSWKKTQNADEGYDIGLLRLTNSATSGAKPDLMVTAALHAREYTTAEFATRLAERLLESYETDADVRWLLDHQEIHIVPMANPDGRKHAEAGNLRRKNDNTSHCPDGRPGIDLNRNWPYGWGKRGSSSSECSWWYRGAEAASEPETKAVKTYIDDLWDDVRGPDYGDVAPDTTDGLHLDIHSYSELVLWPFGFTRTNAGNRDELRRLARKLSVANGYRPILGINVGTHSGSAYGYTYGELGRAALLFELGKAFFEPCDGFENRVLEGNVASLIEAAKASRAPYLLPKGPDVVDVTLSGDASTTGVSAGTSVTLTGTADDTRYSTRSGTEPSQNVAAAEFYVDTPPWGEDASETAMSASDGAFDNTSESVTATIDTTGWSSGRHTVFVRAKDADDDWGPVSAVFLFVDSAPPSAPSAPTLTPSPRRLAVSWSAPAANGAEVTGYRLRHKPADRHFDWTYVDAGTALERTLSDLAPNSPLEFQVRAVNGVGGSAWSPSSTATPENSPATGTPEILGNPLVGSTLTSSVSPIADDDGLAAAAFSHRWFRVRGGVESGIRGATDSTYLVQAGDVGATLKVVVTFTDDAGTEESLASVATGTAGALSAVAVPVSLSESSGSVSLAVSSGAAALQEELVVSVALSGDAVRGADYSITSDSLTLGPLVSSATTTIAAVDDSVDEQDETIRITVSHSGRSSSELTVRLLDDDTRGVTVSESTLPVTEGSTASYTVALDSEPSGSVTVTPSVPSSTDVSVSPASLTFGSSGWDVERALTVSAAEDTDASADPPVVIRHSVSGGDYGSVSARSVTVTIAENDASALSSVDVSGSESSSELVFTVEISLAGTSDVTVDYATSDVTARAGSDYASTSGTLTFPRGSDSSHTIAVPLLGDDADESEEETFRLTLSNVRNGLLAGGGSQLRVTGTIRDDDDPAVAASFGHSSYPVTEGASVRVVVRLDKDPERTVTLPLVSTPRGGASGPDHSDLPSNVTFGPGRQRVEFEFSATDDGEEEGVEEIELSFGSLLPPRVTAGAAAVLSIRDKGGASPPGGPGGPPPPPPDDDEDDGGGGGGGGGFTPPRAAIRTDAVCADGLCRAVTGAPIRFEDASTGSVRRRSWDFGEGSSRNAMVDWSWSAPGFHEVTLEVSGGERESTDSLVFLVEAGEPAGTCAAAAGTLCLQDSRFSVEVEWWTASGERGAGRVVRRGTNDSGLFSFFGGGNWEMLVKVLDGCALNGHVWVFGALTTDLGYRIAVTDTVTGASKEYRNEPGAPAAAVTDATAFPASCGGQR